LRGLLPENSTIESAVSCFESMCSIKIESKEDDLLYETGTFNFTGKNMFYFSLVRQFRGEDQEDEYMQLHLDILYDPTKETKRFSNVEWSDGDFSNFFKLVKSSKAYIYLVENKIPIQDIQIFCAET
ncbi:MAG: hypothetical protein AAGU32_12030, partial [Bacillota bacterium]